MVVTNRKRSAPDNGASNRAKRQLVEDLAGLSLDGYAVPTSVSHKPPSPIVDDYMDINGPNTVFIPSIDDFLDGDDDEESSRARAFLEMPRAVLYTQVSPKLHFYQRPSMALIQYEHPLATLYKGWLAWRQYQNNDIVQDYAADDSMDIDF